MNLLMDSIIDNKKNRNDDLFKVEKEILEHEKPNIWNVFTKGNMERILEVDFQKFALAVTQESNLVLEKTMTFVFYAEVELLKERNKK